ncbi:MAG: hypothetical protein ABI334_07270 [Candidatus Dormiibacterota bacterium]
MTLALDASGGGGLELQTRRWNGTSAALADSVCTPSQTLEGAFDLLPVLVEQVDQEVGCLTIGQRLRQVDVLGNPGDHAAGHIVQRPVQASLLAALRGQELELPAVGLEPRLWSVFSSIASSHLTNPHPN